MLLIDRVLELGDQSATCEIDIRADSSFFLSGRGVPAWVGIEYLGQTAACIAGHQLELGRVQAHLGLLLGTRRFDAHRAFFFEGQVLRAHCSEIAVVGEELATFLGELYDRDSGVLCASAKLSVFRKPLQEANA